jgi:hypothetical protein
MLRRKPQRLNLKFVSSIPKVDPECSLVSCSVANDGSGLFLFIMDDTDNDVHGRIEKGASFPKTKMPNKKKFKLIIQNECGQQKFDIDEVNFTFPLCDVFNDGKIVIVGSRTQWRTKNDYDLNGLIFNPVTGERVEFLAGDGVAGLGVDDNSRIFISYFDEGVFGNNGWGHPGPSGPGAGGLCCFDETGKLDWQFNSNDGSGEFISDCYAMNISASRAYVYYYTDFSLCEIGPKYERTFWKPNVSGCHSFAINDDLIVFSGQYDDPDTRFHLIKRFPNHLSKPSPIDVNLEFGKLTRANRAICRGSYIHHFNDDGWFRASISTLKT